MFSTLRTRFGIPGVISVIALVFAMLGGAYAASNSGDGKGATASAKKKAAKGAKGAKGPRGPKGATGPAGPAGAAGPAGPAGAKGDAGANGADGAKGTTGTTGASVTNTAIDPGELECDELGGAEFKVGSGTPTFACNGEDGEQGEPWTAGGTLPPGETQTGAWGTIPIDVEGEFFGYAPISFPLPLSAELGGANVKVVTPAEWQPATPTVPAECEDATHTGNANPDNPEADPGYLCVYLQTSSFPGTVGIFKSGGAVGNPADAGASTAGAILFFETTDQLLAPYGTFAVTAPTS